MSFFKLPPPPPEPRELRVPWIRPPANEIGAAVALDLVLGRSDRAAVWIPSANVYSTGVELTVEIRYRPTDDVIFDEPLLVSRPGVTGRQARSLPDKLLRVGVEFSDGRKATSLDPLPLPQETETSDPLRSAPVFHASGGGGGRTGTWSHSFFLWPLPPPGRLAFVCEWPAAQIPLTRREVEAGLILDATAQAQRLWDASAG